MRQGTLSSACIATIITRIPITSFQGLLPLLLPSGLLGMMMVLVMEQGQIAFCVVLLKTSKTTGPPTTIIIIGVGRRKL